MQVTPLEFNHDKDHLGEALGLTLDKVSKMDSNRELHLKEFVRCVIEDKAVDPIVLRLVSASFADAVKTHGLAFPNCAKSPAHIAESLLSFIVLPHDKHSEFIERIEKNFIEGISYAEDSPQRLALLSVMGLSDPMLMLEIVKYATEKRIWKNERSENRHQSCH